MINENKIKSYLEKQKKESFSFFKIQEILLKAKQNAIKATNEFSQSLALEDVAALLNVDSRNEKIMNEIFSCALEIKQMIYGNRIVLFAPLYVSNYCSSSCLYCGFRKENKQINRKILNKEELIQEVEILQKQGHKRLLMLTGDHPLYSIDNFIEDIKIVSAVKTKPNGEIRRINAEIPALDIDDFKKLKDTNKIGTFSLFQETYHKKTYQKMHPFGPKSDYSWRLDTMDRALKAGMDDVGLGVLFGLYDYRFEILALLTHANHLDKKFSIGPHTISIPRIQPSINTPTSINPPCPVNDLDFKKLVAIIRLALPYTGIILTTRESPLMRKDLLQLGVSQMSAGSKTQPGAYKNEQNDSSQFFLSDKRPTKDVIYDLIQSDFIPSWCTACYRSKRTGQAFMDIAKKGLIHNLCHPNALLTFLEYLIDYADDKTKKAGWDFINKEIEKISSNEKKQFLYLSIEKIKNGKRDLYI